MQAGTAKGHKHKRAEVREMSGRLPMIKRSEAETKIADVGVGWGEKSVDVNNLEQCFQDRMGNAAKSTIFIPSVKLNDKDYKSFATVELDFE